MINILLIGASSYVGARIYFDLKRKYAITGTYNNNPLSSSFIKLDITDKYDVQKVFSKINPDIVIHVANYPSPRNAVNNESSFIKLNDQGTINIVEGANEIKAKVVFISSQASNNPTDIYGKLKAKSEKFVTTTKEGYLILRPSLIVGFSPNTINPRPFNRMLKCLDDKTAAPVFDTSWKLQPTYIGHLSQVIEKVINHNMWNKIIPVFIDELVTQYKIARDILKTYDINAEKTDQHINIPPSKDDLREFNSFGLSPHTYAEMIELIIWEINNREQFKV